MVTFCIWRHFPGSAEESVTLKNLWAISSSVFFYRVFSIICMFLSSVLIARILGPEGRGILTSYLVMPMLVATISEFGMRQSAIYFIGKDSASTKTIPCLMLYLLIAGTIGFLGCFFYFVASKNTNDYLLFILVSLMVYNYLFINGLNGVFIGFSDVKIYNYFIFAQNFLLLVFVCFVFASKNSNFITIIMSYYFSSTLISLALAITIWKRYKKKIGFTLSLDLFFDMLKKSILFGSVYALIVLNYKLGQVLLSNASDLTSLGYYVTSTQIVELIWQVPAAFMVVVLSRTVNSQSGKEEICNILTVTFVLILCACVFLALFGEILISVIFGSNFSESYYSLLYLLPGTLLIVPFKIIHTYYAGKGNLTPSFKIIIACFFLNLIMSLSLREKYSFIGISISASFSFSIAGFLMLIHFIRQEKVGFKLFFTFKNPDKVS